MYTAKQNSLAIVVKDKIYYCEYDKVINTVEVIVPSIIAINARWFIGIHLLQLSLADIYAVFPIRSNDWSIFTVN